MLDRLAALQSSVARLHTMVEGLSANQLRASAYPAEWTVAQVLSHVGSAAVIMRQRVEDGLANRKTDEAFAPSVWDEWNAKGPDAMAADALVADRALLDRLESVTDDERQRLSISLGPMQFGFDGMVGLRLNEHVMHTWDVDVTFDATATLPADAPPLLIDNLALVGRFGGRPTGSEGTVHVHTSAPERAFVVAIGLEAVTLEPVVEDDADSHAADLDLPAEAFVRLVYGRLDPAHSPIADSSALDVLRRVYQGI